MRERFLSAQVKRGLTIEKIWCNINHVVLWINVYGGKL